MLTTTYARTEITLTIAAGALTTAVVAYFLGLWALVPALVAIALLMFYRNPPRRSPTDENVILAPADGKIVEITRETEDASGAQWHLRIMVFLSVFNVHVNRSPCAGRVVEVTYQPGEFLSALRPEADTRNESNTLTIEPQAPLPGPLSVRQIAGVLARRIVCTAEAGDELVGGQRFGMIKLGSRTEVRLPEDSNWQVCVSVGDKVKAGLTVLARLGGPETG